MMFLWKYHQTIKTPQLTQILLRRKRENLQLQHEEKQHVPHRGGGGGGGVTESLRIKVPTERALLRLNRDKKQIRQPELLLFFLFISSCWSEFHHSNIQSRVQPTRRQKPERGRTHQAWEARRLEFKLKQTENRSAHSRETDSRETDR